jgi:hypothetical protein
LFGYNAPFEFIMAILAILVPTHPVVIFGLEFVLEIVAAAISKRCSAEDEAAAQDEQDRKRERARHAP